MGTKGAEKSEENEVSLTSKFVLAADLPVLVIPATYQQYQLQKIVLALGDEKIQDTSALNTLLDVSNASQAEVHVLTVSGNKEIMGYSRADQHNENTLQYYLEMFYSHHSFAENEDIVQGIDDYINKREIDMLAIMPRTHSKEGKPSKGRLTEAVTLKSNVPILILD
jgi:hypothetical protein